MLTDIHRLSAKIIGLERQTGKVRRMTKDLRNQCDNEKEQRSAVKIEQLRDDLEVIREENAAMKKELKFRERSAAAAGAKKTSSSS